MEECRHFLSFLLLIDLGELMTITMERVSLYCTCFWKGVLFCSCSVGRYSIGTKKMNRKKKDLTVRYAELVTCRDSVD